LATGAESPVTTALQGEGETAVRPVMLAIVGDSAAGKTTFTEGVVGLLGDERVAMLCTDDYHRYDRVQRRELDVTPLDPEGNYMDVMSQHVRLLAAGEPILKPVYDHSNGSFAPPEYVVARQFMVVEGLLGLTAKPMRDCFAVKVFLDPPEDLRRGWKINRDCAKRGYTPEQVLEDLERRESDSAAFIRPQREFADIVVRFEPPNGVVDSSHLSMRMVLRPIISHRDLTELAAKACSDGCESIQLELGRDEGHPVDLLYVSADISPDETAHVESLLWDRMDFDHHLERDDIGTFVEGNRRRHSDCLAIAQLFITYHLLNAAAERH
jgi:phosphoribulokinase